MHYDRKAIKDGPDMRPGLITSGGSASGGFGLCYGPFQFVTSSGLPERFTNWLVSQRHPYGRILATWPPGTREFSAAWIYLGEQDPGGFLELQRSYYEEFVLSCDLKQA